MKPKHVTINRLIKENGFTNYLEIGYGQGHNFRLIDCESKMTCDPETVEMEVVIKDGSVMMIKAGSDEFFEITTDKFDIIFIDGLHHADQVEKDILNSWKRIKVGGLILLHDVVPPTEAAQIVPRKQSQWTGDVWRAFVGFREAFPDIETGLYPEKYGLGYIRRSRHKVEPGFVNNEMSYHDFAARYQSLLGMDKELYSEYL